MENHAKYGDTIYFHGDDTLYVNLFIASELTWKERGLVVRQETRFPDEDRSRLTFTATGRCGSRCAMRHPAWARRDSPSESTARAQPLGRRPGPT